MLYVMWVASQNIDLGEISFVVLPSRAFLFSIATEDSVLVAFRVTHSPLPRPLRFMTYGVWLQEMDTECGHEKCALSGSLCLPHLDAGLFPLVLHDEVPKNPTT